MNLERFKVFQTVAKLGSFTGAAEKLYLTQPAISKHIKALEEYYNTPLFDRLANKVVLTPAGETLLAYIDEILSLAEEAKEALEKLQQMTHGNLHIGASTTVGIQFLPHILSTFKSTYPNLKVSVYIDNSKQVVKGILDNSLEVGLVGAVLSHPSLSYLPFRTEKLKLIVSCNHPWAVQEPKTPEELTNALFFLREEGSGMRKVLEEKLLEHGIKLKSVMELSNTEVIIRMVETGMGVAILSEYAIEREVNLRRIKALDLPFLNLKRHFYLVYNRKKAPSPAFKAFVHHINSIPVNRSSGA